MIPPAANAHASNEGPNIEQAAAAARQSPPAASQAEESDDAEDDEISSLEDFGKDGMLMPVDPRLSAPSIALDHYRTFGNTGLRRRLFCAKQVLGHMPGGYIRRKRGTYADEPWTCGCDPCLPHLFVLFAVAKKSVLAAKHSKRDEIANNRSLDEEWNSYFSNELKPDRMPHHPPQKNNSSQPKKPPANKKASAGRGAGISRPVEVYRGPPTEDLPGGWPEGWCKIMVERQGGDTKGTKDRYWYSPGNHKFRSMIEVKKFLKALQECGGDESQAKKIYKSMVL